MTRVHTASRTAEFSRDRSIPRRKLLTIALAVIVTAALFSVTYAEAPAAASSNPDSVVLVGGGVFDVWVDVVPGAGVGRLYFGDVADVPLMGDWDCDGVDSPGVFRPSVGRVFLRDGLSSGTADRVFSFGVPGDVPLAGDFDGDGCDSVSVYRPSEGRVYVSNSLVGGPAEYVFYFGVPGDAPFAGDFDGDGVDTVGTYRASDGRVYFRNANSAGVAEFHFFFGNPGDQFVAGDWDGDGIDTVAAYRSSNGVLYLKNSHRTGVADTSVPVGSYRYVAAASGIPESAATAPPPASPASPAAGGVYVPDVHVYPGDDLAGLAKASPVGTVFMVHGEHSGVSVKPRDGQVFVGAGDAVLDGGGQVRYAFSGSASDVVVQGLEIRDYKPPAQFGSVHVTASGWLVVGNEVHGNAGAGITVRDGDRVVIRGNRVHHNHQLGLRVEDTVGTVIEGNEIAYNNWLEEFNWGWEGGGTKFWDTEGLVVRNNHSHHNFGPGLWDDYNNNDVLYEGNVVEDNAGPGIFHEISYKATIRNNTIRRNGSDHGAWLWGAGIVIAASQDTEVYGNIVQDNANGISLIQQNRGSGDRGAWIVRNNYVHDNEVSGGKTGAVQDIGSTAIFRSNNRFENNRYSGDVRWAWNGSTSISWAKWQAAGHDTTGTYNP